MGLKKAKEKAVDEARKRKRERGGIIINIDEGDNARWLAILRQKRKKNAQK